VKKTLIILNPEAQSGRARTLWGQLKKIAPGAEIRCTRKPGDAMRWAAKAVVAGVGCVVAAGGDGTVHEVVNGLRGSNVPLGIIPLGTMNVFAMELGIPVNDLEGAWRVVASGQVRMVDLPLAGSTAFVQLAGAGLDAEVVAATTPEFKKALGPLSYVFSLVHVAARQPPELLVAAEDRGEFSCRFVLVGNGRFYGGPLLLFRDAKLDDGLLDVVLFRNQSHWDIVRYFQAILFGTHTELSDVEYFQTRSLNVSSRVSVPYELDGELAGKLPVEFTVDHGGLPVLAPVC
jgi:diacylglycerol kinase (ATP)